ncbi:preprotein translocase subunit SecE [Pseudoroseomonas wenyumeiae]
MPRRAALLNLAGRWRNKGTSMAEVKHDIDFVEVKAEDIVGERAHGWSAFTKATTWGIVAVTLLLLMLYGCWG